MYFRLRQPKLLSSIPRVKSSVALLRKHYSIAIIDNEPFPYTNELIAHGFAVKELGDIKDFCAVAEYSIIACDIKDVGHHFGTSYEGAHVISEIRKRYPDKFIIAYSGGAFGAEYKRFWDYCDIFLRRDVGFDQWKDTLDCGVDTIGDPIRRWKRICDMLLEANMPIFEVFLLEDAYITSILKKDLFVLDKALERASRVQSAEEIIENISVPLITFVKLFTLLTT